MHSSTRSTELPTITVNIELAAKRGFRLVHPEPQTELLTAASRRRKSALERRKITAPDRLPQARGADEASACATGAVIDYLLLPLHRV